MKKDKDEKYSEFSKYLDDFRSILGLEPLIYPPKSEFARAGAYDKGVIKGGFFMTDDLPMDYEATKIKKTKEFADIFHKIFKDYLDELWEAYKKYKCTNLGK